MLRNKLLEDLKAVVVKLGFPTPDIVLSIPKNPAFGDYTTNMALQLAKLDSTKGKQALIDIANKIVDRLQVTGDSKKYLDKIEAAGGFINFFISDKELLKNTDNLSALSQSSNPQKVLIEYGHVNLLKEIHIGHLRTFILGESLCRIYESLGHQVFRANYQGDIGLHIAKAIWGIKQIGLSSKQLSLKEKAKFLGQAYAQGNTSYDGDQEAKQAIDKINTALYQKDPELKEIYSLARSWSLEYFEPIYELLGIKYDRCFFESEVYEEGKKIVLGNIGKVFEKNSGAVVFPGEKYGLHTRVFITSVGNPTYEGKEVGLAELEYDTFPFEKSIHVVASEQEGYFQVVIKAIEMIFPYLEKKKYHLSYGVVDLKEGKMSSRTGNVVTVDDLYHVVSEKVREVVKQSRININQEVVEMVALGAIKFAYLKFSPRPNMVFDIEESISLEGDSGPYIQYTYARIQSVLNKAASVILSERSESKDLDSSLIVQNDNMNEEVEIDISERAILRRLLYFQEIVEQAAESFHPNLLASYLVELSRLYNLFYQASRIIGSDKESLRLKLSLEAGEVLKKGLSLLGIAAPERM